MRISIDLKQEEIEAIRQLAERERRTPRDHAAWLLSKMIAESGVKADEPADPKTEDGGPTDMNDFLRQASGRGEPDGDTE